MSEIVNHPNYFKPYKHKEIKIENWYTFVSSLTGEKIKVYKFKGDVYTYNKEDGFEKMKQEDLTDAKLDIKPLDDFFKNELYVYKNVKKVGERLISNWDNDFEYKIGEYAIARGKKWDGEEAGLFVLQSIEEAKDHHYNKDGNVIIELKLDTIDDLLDLENFTVSKALVVREVG